MTEAIRISRITRGPGGYKLAISGLDQPLMVPEELLHRYRLKEGVVLTEPQLNQLLAEAEMVRCEQVVGRLLAMHEHSLGEIRAKLRQRKFTKDVIEPTTKKFQAAGLLDDARMAHGLARRLYERKPSGRSFLVAALRRKMIERSLAEQAVDRLLEGEDETVAATRALEQKWPMPDQIDIESIRSKAYSYLSRRGFGYQAARAAVTQLFETTGKVAED